MSYRTGQVNAHPLQRELSLPAFYSEILVAAVCLLAAGRLGLPAATRALRLWRQGVSFPRDEAANDERFVG